MDGNEFQMPRRRHFLELGSKLGLQVELETPTNNGHHQ